MATRKKKKAKKRGRKGNPQMSDKLFDRVADYQEMLERVSSFGERLVTHLTKGTALYGVVSDFNDRVDSVIEELDDLMGEAD